MLGPPREPGSLGAPDAVAQKRVGIQRVHNQCLLVEHLPCACHCFRPDQSIIHKRPDEPHLGRQTPGSNQPSPWPEAGATRSPGWETESAEGWRAGEGFRRKRSPVQRPRGRTEHCEASRALLRLEQKDGVEVTLPGGERSKLLCRKRAHRRPLTASEGAKAEGRTPGHSLSQRGPRES